MDRWREISSLWQVKIVGLMILMLTLGLSISMLPVDTQAQGPAQPTPTNIGDGGGSGGGTGGSGDAGDGSSGVSTGGNAGISGFVYNYSTYAYEGGVSVVVTGDGWEVETLTDSRGYYQVNGLGTGRAVVNLRLPPGAQPVVVDWPLWTFEGADLTADLGFYWGDDPPLPVLLSADLARNILTVQVENFTDEAATGGVVEVETPGGIDVSPAVEIGQGSASLTYDPHEPRLDLSEIPAGGSVMMQFSLMGAAVSEANPVRVTFTYDQQYTPQVLVLGSEWMQPLVSAEMAAAEQHDQDQSAMVSDTPQTAATPGSDSADALPASESGSMDSPTGPTPIPQLPQTGTPSPATSFASLLALVLIVGLVAAGSWSLVLAQRRRNQELEEH